ncbi:MAG: methionyl-tRNA formyltransferase [Pseudobdellovibrionaceae bacterium]
MSKIRICFLGTPDFAAACLTSLLQDEHYEVVGVVTQPDRPSGRKMLLTPSPVKMVAQAQGLKVLSPESLKDQSWALAEIQSWRAEVAVVVAFGQILTENFLQLFNFGVVNVHASLLPRWRGAAPIQRSIEAGDTHTGVCLQKVVKKLDAGDVLGLRSMAISADTDSLQLHDQMIPSAVDLLKVELMDYVRGNLVPTPQDESKVTYAKKLDKRESELDWNLSAEALDRKIRAFVWGPGTYSYFRGKKIKIHRTEVDSLLASSALGTKLNGDSLFAGAPPAVNAEVDETSVSLGTIVSMTNEWLLVKTNNNLLKIFEVQPESRNRMPVSDFVKGYGVQVGDVFGK